MQTRTETIANGDSFTWHIPDAVYFLLVGTGFNSPEVDVELFSVGNHRELAKSMPPGFEVEVPGDTRQDLKLSKVKITNNSGASADVTIGFSVYRAAIQKLNIEVSGAIKLGGNPIHSDQVVSVTTSTTGAQVAANSLRGQGSSLQNHGPNVCWIRYGADPVPGSFQGIAVGVGQVVELSSTQAVHMITATGTAEVYVNEEDVSA